MNNLAIRVENLSKLYKIGAARHDTLRDQLAHRFHSLFSRNGGSPKRSPGDFWALKDVSFEVKHGEVVGIIGRNGAGKSTLLKILSRITQPTQGRGTIYGRVGSLLEVGTGFHPELTGRENIYLNGAMLGMGKAEIARKFDEIVGFAEFSRFIDTPVKRYSSGMYVRLAFAVAAHLEPEILIIDEVLAVGDIAFQKKCLAKMSDVAKAGRTVLFVSHNMGSLRRLCSRCLWMDDGQVRMSGETAGTIAAYVAAAEPGAKMASGFPVDRSKESQLRSVRMLNRAGKEARGFQCDEPVHIEITYQVHREVAGLYAYMAILGEDGAEVLVSDSRDSAPNPFDALGPGEHTIVITIPPRSLGHGDYQIFFDTASIFSRNHANVDAPGVIGGFHLDDDSSLRGNKRGGVFSTLLDWRAAAPEPAVKRESGRM